MQRALPYALKHLVTRRANPEARKLVLGVIAQNAPITVQELYKQTTKEQEKLALSADSEPLPIPSMRCVLLLQLSVQHGAIEDSGLTPQYSRTGI